MSSDTEVYIKVMAKALQALNENIYDIAKSLRTIAHSLEKEEIEVTEAETGWKNVEEFGLPKHGTYCFIALKFLDQNDEIAYTAVSNIGNTFVYQLNDQTYIINRERILAWKVFNAPFD